MTRTLNFCLHLVLLGLACLAHADIPIDFDPNPNYKSWEAFEKSILLETSVDTKKGKSQILSGTLALVAGLIGAGATDDPIEKGVYSIFQSLGITSIGFGYYDQVVGSEDRKLYEMIKQPSNNLTTAQKDEIVRNYLSVHQEFTKKENRVKLTTFSLLAITYLYNGSRVQNESIRNSFYFIGGINALVALSFAF